MAKEGNGIGTLSFGNDHEYVDDADEDDDGDGGDDGHEKMMCERDGLG